MLIIYQINIFLILTNEMIPYITQKEQYCSFKYCSRTNWRTKGEQKNKQ